MLEVTTIYDISAESEHSLDPSASLKVSDETSTAAVSSVMLVGRGWVTSLHVGPSVSIVSDMAHFHSILGTAKSITAIWL